MEDRVTLHSYKILLFAMLREKAGDSIVVNLAQEEVTVQDLVAGCAAQFPQLKPWLPHTKIAVNQVYATNDMIVQPEDEIAFIPPVAGG
jgi:molybdopterin synthase catalytic subunit